MNPNHPAVEAAHDSAMAWLSDMRGELPGDEMVCVLTAALPHLESATEDNLARLRDTPAGRALMDEVWAECADEAHALGWLHDAAREDLDNRNPYRN